jgi:hypothetical protein
LGGVRRKACFGPVGREMGIGTVTFFMIPD